jgi:hypothetical protein
VTDTRRCVVCHHAELADDQPQTCPRCVDRVRADLAAVVRLHGVLDAEITGRAGAAATRPTRGSDPDTPLSALLCLLGPGSNARDRDAQPDDPPSVAWTLASWEDDWRHIHRHAAATGPATVTSAAAYLDANHTWAANWHPAFPEYAADLTGLLGHLRTATRTGTDGLKLEGWCFACGHTLVRDYAPAQPCRHPGDHTDRCDQGGLRDHARCVGCGAHYTAARYTLALRGVIETEVAKANAKRVTSDPARISAPGNRALTA